MVPQGLAPGNDPLPQSVAIRAPHCRGVVAASCERDLQPLFAALPRTEGTVEVKRSTVRTVLRGTFGALDVHLKIHRAVTLSDRARDALRGNRGAREAANLLRARGLDLPVAEPLACGAFVDEAGCSRSFLVTQTIAGAAPFSFDVGVETLQHTGRLLRRMHDRGLVPGDLHPGNLVVDHRGLPWLLDLFSVRHSGEPGLARRAEGLAAFCQELDAGPLDAGAEPLLTAYRTAGRQLPDAFDRELEQKARAFRRRALAAFGRRSSRPCRHTAVSERRRGELRWQLHLLEDTTERDALYASCRAFAAAPPPADKEGRRGAVWLLTDLAVKERDQGAARKLFTASYWLLYAKVPQPEPVAIATSASRGYVFTRRLPLPSIAVELQRGSLSGSDLVAAARALGEAVGRLHANGLRNRDLKFENLVRDPDGRHVRMVDLDGVRRKGPDDTRGQGADLGRLAAAFAAAGQPGGMPAFQAFARSYLRTRRRLLEPAKARRLWHTAIQRAKAWASAHA